MTEPKDGFKAYRQQHNGLTWKDYVDLRLSASDKALEVAKKEMDRRLEGMNELRGQLDRQAGTFVAREHYDSSISRIVDMIRAVEQTVTTLDKNTEGRISAMTSEKKAYVTAISIAVSAVVSILVGVVVALVVKGAN